MVNYATYVREAAFQYYREDERPGSYLTPNALQGLAADFCEGLSSCQNLFLCFFWYLLALYLGFYHFVVLYFIIWGILFSLGCH